MGAFNVFFSKPPLGTPLDWGNPLNDETVMALAMNEGHGDRVQDLSLNGNHGTLYSMAFPSIVNSGWNPGQTGVGLNFDGTNDYVDCGNDSSLKPANFSIAAIVCAKTLSPGVHTNVIISNGNNYNNAYGFGLMCGDDTLTFWIGDDTLNRKNEITSAFSINTWYKIVGTYEEGVGSKLYVDGDLKSSTSTFTGSIVYDTLDFMVGKLKTTYYHFNGPIDQVRFQSRAWSAKEVKDYAINPWQVYLDEND